jgi:flagellar basal-body rod modification protein FlgD
MISVKGGTKTWSDASQQSSLKNDRASNMSSSDKTEQFGGEDVGAILNKISDPNWVDPAKKARQVGNNQLDKDAFLNLLLAQMKNQDPTNPLKSHEMAAQLAQFTSLEKLSSIDDGIEKLTKAQSPTQNFEALEFIGKLVSGDGAKIHRTNQEDGHDIKFNLMNDAQVAKLNIVNENGEVVRTLTVNTLKAGKNEVFWNGTLEDGTPARPGEYTVEIEAKGSNGAKLHAETKFQGKVTGVNFTAGGPVLMVGKQQVAMREVTEIIDPALLRESQQMLGVPTAVMGDAPAAAPAASVKPPVPAVKPETGKSPAPKGNGNLESVAMSRGMINDLSKEGAYKGM